MKNSYTFLFILLLAAKLQATTITAIVNNGQWDVNSTWNLNRQPQHNDTIYIPAGITIFLDQHVVLDNINLIINGTLQFSGGKLTLNNVCTIFIQSAGRIIGSGNNEQIRLGGVFKYKGNEGTISGPKLANSLSGDGFIPVMLPVRFTGFFAKRNADKIELTWITAEETNNSHFDVQRSTDGQNWMNIAVVFAVTNPGPVNRYFYTDHYSGTGKVYYRLKQVDNDGRYTFSAIKTVNFTVEIASSNIYVAAKQTIAVEFIEPVKEKVIVRIFNINGQPVKEIQFNQVSYRIEVLVPNALPGIYAVQVLSGQKIRDVKKVML
jgi:hypothetical protein